MAFMDAKRVRHLPVIENDVVIGIVSISDVVKAIIEMQKRNHQAFGFLYFTIKK